LFREEAERRLRSVEFVGPYLRVRKFLASETRDIAAEDPRIRQSGTSTFADLAEFERERKEEGKASEAAGLRCPFARPCHVRRDGAPAEHNYSGNTVDSTNKSGACRDSRNPRNSAAIPRRSAFEGLLNLGVWEGAFAGDHPRVVFDAHDRGGKASAGVAGIKDKRETLSELLENLARTRT
jgi:hypothetical protein